MIEFVPFTRRLRAESQYREGEVGHLCESLESAWTKQHKDTLEFGRMDNDPHLSDLAERLLNEIDTPTYIGVARVAGSYRTYILRPDGVDLVKIVLEASEVRGNHLRGLERLLLPPLEVSYTEVVTDFGPELDQRDGPRRPPAAARTFDERLGLVVTVATVGLDEPIALRIWPSDLAAFEPIRDILREWARRRHVAQVA